MTSYISEVSSLINISRFLEDVASKDHVDKKKAYAASSIKLKLDVKIVDLVSDVKFMEFVDEIKNLRTLKESELDLAKLISAHDSEVQKMINSKDVFLDPSEPKMHEDDVKELQKPEAHKAEVSTSDSKPKKKSPSFKRVT